jgi:hypothetical protein
MRVILDGLQQSLVVPPDQLLAPLEDVVPAGTAADAEEVSDRGCHVAAAVNRKFPPRAVSVINSDEPLITATDGTFTLIARHADWGGRLLCVINDRDVPSLAEEDGHDQQRE